MPPASASTTAPSTDRVIEVTDQLGRLVHLPGPPTRIVSLVPSQTELLFSLGLGRRVVGVTRYCVHPADAVAPVEKIGGTKRFRFDLIDALEPDLVIGNKEENYPEGIKRLEAKYPVFISDVETYDDALAMIRAVGTLTDTRARADALNADIDAAWSTLPRTGGTSVAYLVWRKPWMAVGDGTFIGNVLARLNFVNRFAGSARYPEITLDALRTASPQVVMLSSEPFPFTDEHVAELETALPHSRVLRVDGEPFSWYGSRLLGSPAYFSSLLAQLGCAGGEATS